MRLLAPNARGTLHWLLWPALLITAATPMWAALGDTSAAVVADQARWHGTLASTDKGAFTVHEITVPSGAKIREYVSPAGAVFGVAWDGQFAPNFQDLLGPYYQQLQQAIAEQKAANETSTQTGGQPVRRRRGPVMIETPGLVFAQSGHLRSFHGQAYIPQLVPQGVQTSDIR